MKRVMKRRILFLSPVPTHPQSAGNRTRVASLLTALVELGYDVTFLHIEQEPGDGAAMQTAWGASYHRMPYRRPATRWTTRLRRRILGRFSANARYNLTIDEWYDPALDQRLKELQKANPFHAVIASYVFFSRALLNFDPGVTRIIDTHDAFANRYRQYLAHGEKPKWFSTSPSGEGRAMDRADLVFAIQDRERGEFARLTRTDVITLGHITPVDPVTSQSSPAPVILFVASENGINVHGIQHFIDDIFPAVRDAVPAAELRIAGSVCRALVAQPGLVLLGRVDDLRTAYAEATVIINPVQFKTGVAIKNLEAMGYGRPLVTASIGAEGMEDGRGTAFLDAGDDPQFAHQVIRVLTDRDLATRLSGQAIEYIRSCNQRIRDTLIRCLGPPDG